jgi:ribosomal protein L11 methylase PrmA
VEEKVFAIDFDEKAVRVARTLNLIAGDGQTNVLHLNTLDYELSAILISKSNNLYRQKQRFNR